MPAAARLGDKAQVDADAHGCPACPHPGVGPIVTASTDVFVNRKGAARQDDLGIHAVCCGPNNFTVTKGSPAVYVDDGADASGLGQYAIAAAKILLEKAAESKQKQPKKASGSHKSDDGKPAEDVSKDQKDERRSGSILSA